MSQSILYRSKHDSLFLLDIPASIQEAQASERHLLSVPPIEQPYETPEPKGRKRDKLLESIPATVREENALLHTLLKGYLHIIGGDPDISEWCLHRRYTREGDVPININNSPPQWLNSGPIQPPLILSTSPNYVADLGPISNVVVINPFNRTTSITVSGSDSYHIPPNAVFLSSTVERGLPAFTQAIQYLHACSEKRSVNAVPRFDLILLDPPWANRSVRRNRTYVSEERQSSDPFEETLPLVDSYLRADGYVAVWITNKAKIRTQVGQALERLGLHMVEEWVWLKCTTQGAPVTPIDGVWRKPYEFMLLFSRRTNHQARRKTIVGVPDIHSRKPNLKALFETFLPKDYCALELFARSLTAGWWAWGDEALKFQHESNWSLIC